MLPLILLPLSGICQDGSTRSDSIRQITIDGVIGAFVPFRYVPLINGMYIQRNTYQQANDSLNSIILNQDNRFFECQKAITSLQNQNRYLYDMNSEYVVLVSKCENDNKGLRLQVKILKTTIGISGVVVIGALIAVVVK